MPPLAGEEHCYIHSPGRARERAAARKRGGKARMKALKPPVPAKVERGGKLGSVEDVLAALERILAEGWQLKRDAAKVRAITAVCLAALRGLEVGELESRLEALEQRLDEQSARGLGPRRIG